MEELWGRLAEDKAVAAVNQPLPSQAVKNFGVCRVGHGSSPIVNVSVNLWLACSRVLQADDGNVVHGALVDDDADRAGADAGDDDDDEEEEEEEEVVVAVTVMVTMVITEW